MTRKLIKTLVFLTLCYVVPLWQHLTLLADFRLWILVFVFGVVLMTQPDFSLRSARRDSSTDGYSVLAIMLGGVISQIAPVVEWAHSGDHVATPMWLGCGLGLLIAGTAMRIWAIRTLGKYFTATVQVQNGHELIKAGPYRFLRHPSYVGAYVAMLGSAVLVQAPISALVTGLLMAAIYAYRINLENAALQRHFRDVV
jgi:protein-S-isoprenylcysteine O-methyltransferase Ste14